MSDDALLRKMVDLIRSWHDMGEKETPSPAWKIYYENAPEMAEIRAHLSRQEPGSGEEVAEIPKDAWEKLGRTITFRSSDTDLLDWAVSHPEPVYYAIELWWTQAGRGCREIEFNFRRILEIAREKAAPPNAALAHGHITGTADVDALNAVAETALAGKDADADTGTRFVWLIEGVDEKQAYPAPLYYQGCGGLDEELITHDPFSAATYPSKYCAERALARSMLLSASPPYGNGRWEAVEHGFILPISRRG